MCFWVCRQNTQPSHLLQLTLSVIVTHKIDVAVHENQGNQYMHIFLTDDNCANVLLASHLKNGKPLMLRYIVNGGPSIGRFHNSCNSDLDPVSGR